MIGIEVVAFAYIEWARQSQEEKSIERMYPGGNFDPLGLSKDKTEEETYLMRTREIKNGRLVRFPLSTCLLPFQPTDMESCARRWWPCSASSARRCPPRRARSRTCSSTSTPRRPSTC